MTGFGRSQGSVDSMTVSITIRSVNHRYLEISVRSPESMWELDQEIRSRISRSTERGKIDVVLRTRTDGGHGQRVSVNEMAVKDLFLAAQRIESELGLSAAIDAKSLLALPGVVELQAEESELNDDQKRQILDLVDAALADLVSVRENEGTSLKAEIESRLQIIESLWKDVESQRQSVIDEQLEHYRTRIREIGEVVGVELDEERIAQETVIMVEKGDIREEVARIGSHLDQMRSLMNQEKEPAGKKLDFFSQELIREVNTIGSKSRSSTLRSRVVELKSEIERIREQVQ
ncbi:MAG: YicC family protein, partial [Acidobacteria bacterium]|nr:YicC family protein [Acidobacteriota bacterium]